MRHPTTQMPPRPLLSTLSVVCVALAACSAPPPDAPALDELEYLHAPIDAVDELPDGVTAIGLHPAARSFVLHKELTPDHAATLAFAQRARQSGERVYATVWVRERLSKAAPRSQQVTQWPFVIVRLADTPDPRASAPK